MKHRTPGALSLQRKRRPEDVTCVLPIVAHTDPSHASFSLIFNNNPMKFFLLSHQVVRKLRPR